MRYLIPMLLLAGCGTSPSAMRGDRVAVSGNGAERSYAAEGFSRVEILGADDVEIRAGPGFAIRATGAPAVLDRLDLRREGRTLRIGRVDSGWSWRHDGKARLVVEMPAIEGVSLAGSADVTIDRAHDDIDVALAGSGNVVIGDLRGGDASLSVAGSGTIAAAGEVDGLKAEIAGSGNIAAEGLRASHADISIAGSGDVTAQVNGAADVSLAGSGSATLGPASRCRVSRVGSGQAYCG